MKKILYKPLNNFFMKKIMGKKIIGKGSKEEINDLCNKVSKSILKIDNSLNEETISKIIANKLKLLFTENTFKNSLLGADGLAGDNKIFLDKKMFDNIVNKDIEQLQDDHDYHVIVHECIHKLQRTKLFYHMKEVRGFVEGATELMAIRATSRNRSTVDDDIKVNFPNSGSYTFLVSLMAQFEVLYGKDSVKNYALFSNMELLDKVQESLGKENYEMLREDMNRQARNKSPKYRDFNNWQNILMQSYFNEKIGNVSDKESAEKLLEQLKDLDNVRVRIKDDDFYKNYYNETLKSLKDIYPEIDLDKNKYEEREFYPVIYDDEVRKKMDDKAFMDISSTVRTVKEFKELNLENYKRYRYTKENEIYDFITYNNIPKWMYQINTKDGSMLTLFAIGNTEKVFQDEEKKYGLKTENGKTSFTIKQTGNNIDNLELEEIPINIDKKDIYLKMLDNEKIEIKSENIFEKIKRIFKKQEMLLPYYEVKEQNNFHNEKKSWELDSETKQKIKDKNIILANEIAQKGKDININKYEERNV